MTEQKTTGLTLQEAIKSGKPFTRPIYTDFMKYNGINVLWVSDNEAITFSPSDVLATDWTTSEPVYQITKQQLAEAWDKEVYPIVRGYLETADKSPTFADFCNHLGVTE